MPNRKSAAYRLQVAKDRGAGTDSAIINSKRVLKTLQPGTKRNYKHMLDFWNAFKEDYPDTSVTDIESLKRFMRTVALSIDGAEGDPRPCVHTVRKRWDDFSAAWRREFFAISPEIYSTIFEFIMVELKAELNLPDSKRPRRFATKMVLHHLARQLFAQDWLFYQSPATRLNDWCFLLAHVYSAGRIGEYIESSARAKTGRGLYYKELVFAVIINQLDAPEFAIFLERDAKGMTDNPGRRPKHGLYEGLDDEPVLLCFNPMLFFLSRFLSAGAFRDYATEAELRTIIPERGEARRVHWKETMLEKPVFPDKTATKIESAGGFGARFHSLGLRAGYNPPPRPHEFRAEGLYQLNKFVTKDERMLFAGHTDPGTVPKHYLPTYCADGQQAYFGKAGRTDVLDAFRSLSLPRNPELWQCLPAREQYNLENSQEYRALEDKIAARAGSTDNESLKERKELYEQKRKLQKKKLRFLQRKQPDNYDGPPGWHRSFFGRVRSMMPVRNRLANSLFEAATLRSDVGQKALADLQTLDKSHSEIALRPGLEPDKCHCTVDKKLNSNDTWPSYNWQHVYTCHKKFCCVSYGVAEFCFLCNTWILGNEEWHDHCRRHLEKLADLPLWCDPLTPKGVLVAAGYCPFCLGNSDLDPTQRMYQFLRRESWISHIHRHVRELKADRPQSCPHPSCNQAFDSVLECQFHLQDSHGIEYVRDRIRVKRKRDVDEDKTLIRGGKRRLDQVPPCIEDKSPTLSTVPTFTFDNTTMKAMHQRLAKENQTSSASVTRARTFDGISVKDESTEFKLPLKPMRSNHSGNAVIQPETTNLTQQGALPTVRNEIPIDPALLSMDVNYDRHETSPIPSQCTFSDTSSHLETCSSPPTSISSEGVVDQSLSDIMEVSKGETTPSSAFGEVPTNRWLWPGVRTMEATPPNSTCSDGYIDPAILQDAATYSGMDNFVDLSIIDDKPQPHLSATMMNHGYTQIALPTNGDSLVRDTDFRPKDSLPSIHVDAQIADKDYKEQPQLLLQSEAEVAVVATDGLDDMVSGGSKLV